MVSAVPAGDVIARDDVFGIVSPCAATIETTMGVTISGKPTDGMLVEYGTICPAQALPDVDHRLCKRDRFLLV
jgi:hypothetical protein